MTTPMAPRRPQYYLLTWCCGSRSLVFSSVLPGGSGGWSNTKTSPSFRSSSTRSASASGSSSGRYPGKGTAPACRRRRAPCRQPKAEPPPAMPDRDRGPAEREEQTRGGVGFLAIAPWRYRWCSPCERHRDRFGRGLVVHSLATSIGLLAMRSSSRSLGFIQYKR